MLLSAGADVNAQDSMGIAALHWAASRELLDVCKVQRIPLSRPLSTSLDLSLPAAF